MSLFDWFAGNGQYMSLWHCMGGDTFWVVATVLLDIVVAAGYVLIAMHWNENQKSLTNPQTRVAMGRLRNIFLLCGICGYVFIPIKMIWPAWRLYDLFMIALAYSTWRYAWGAKDLKVVYRELRRSQTLANELEESRAESQRKTFFLNAVSHDLKNPLYALSLQAHVIEEAIHDNDPDTAREAIAAVQQCVTDVNALLDHFLELGRLEARADQLRVEPVRVRELVRHVIQPMSLQAQNKGIALTAEVPEHLMLHTDHGRLERVLMNLVSNAIKYTHRGRVRVTAETCDPPASAREGEGAEAGVRISVIDTGVGIEPSQMEKLFEDFFQVDNPERDRKKGFGLGLSIARRLTQQLGGDLEVESELDVGSRFSVVLPMRYDPVGVGGDGEGGVGGEPTGPSLVDAATDFSDSQPQARRHAESLVPIEL